MQQLERLIFIGFKSLDDEPRGIEQVVRTQIQVFGMAANEIVYICFGSPETTYVHGLMQIKVGKSLFKLSIKKILEVRKLCLADKTVVWSHNQILSLLFKTDVLTIHDLLSKQTRGKLKGIIVKFLEQKALRKSNQLVTVSFFRKREIEFENKKLKRNINVIYNCCRFEFEDSRKIAKQTTSHMNSDIIEYLFKAGNQYLFCVRSLEERSDLFWLIETFEQLLKYRKNLKLVIAGGGKLLDKINAFIEKRNLKDSVFCLGYVNEQTLSKLYKNCSMVVVPAKSNEGFGLPVIEGYYHGKTVMASAVDALPEIIIKPKYLFKEGAQTAATQLDKALSSKSNEVDLKNHYKNSFSGQIFSVNSFRILKLTEAGSNR